MKKIIPLFFSIGVTTFSMAQSAKFSLVGGFNIANYNFANPNIYTANGYDKTTTSTIAGFNIGALVDFDINRFTIQPGLIYTTKGSNIDETSYQQTTTTNSTITTNQQKQTLNYLQIPINILYNFPIKKFGKFFIGGGPYLAYGLSGKGNGTSATTVTNGASSNYATTIYSGTVDFGSSSNDVNNPDLGMNTLIGFDLKNKVNVSVDYGFGLTNLANGNSNNKYTNNTLSLSVGYRFL